MMSLTFSLLSQFANVMASPLSPEAEASSVLPAARIGQEYSHQFQAEGGLAPLTWRITRGELPQGLKLEVSGRLHGLLLQASQETYRFTVEVADSSSTPQRFSQEFSLNIQAAPLRIVTSQRQSEPAEPPLRIMMAPSRDEAPSQPLSRIPTAAINNNSEAGLIRTSAVTSPPQQDESNSTTTDNSQKRKVQGRLRPASMDEVFALILSDRELTQDDAIKEQLCKAGFNDYCVNGSVEDRTGEKAAVIRLLQSLLTPLKADAKFSALATYSIKQGIVDNLKEKSSRISRRKLEKLIELLTSYTDNIIIRAEDKSGKLIATTTSNRDGEYTLMLADNQADDHYILSTEADNYYTKRAIVVSGSDLKVSLAIEDRAVSLLTRAVVGYQQAGAASTAFEQNYFFDLFVSQSLPFRQKVDPDFGEPWRTWGAIRAISAPQSGNVTIADLSSNFVTKVKELKANEAARVFDYLGGFEFRLFGNRSLLPSFDRQTKQKFTLSLIASGGFITPTNPNETDPKTYKITDQFRARFKNEAKGSELLTGDELDGKDYVAFVPTDRDRFFRQYYAGFRMQTFFFNRHDVPMQRFPVQLDLQYGINEYVTGGRARGGVFRLDGYFPLPYDNLNFINLFGTAIFRPVRSKIEKTQILEEVDGKFFDAKTATLPVSQFNRDYYRVGIGIDFISFVGKLLRN